MKKELKMKSYVCPKCKEKQTTVIQWQTLSVAFEFELKNGKSERVDEIVGEHEAFTCPSCGEDLPESMDEKIWEAIS